MKKINNISNSARNRFNNIIQRRVNADNLVIGYAERGNFSSRRDFSRARYDIHSKVRVGRKIFPLDYRK